MRAWILIKQWCPSLCFLIFLKTSLLYCFMVLSFRRCCWASCFMFCHKKSQSEMKRLTDEGGATLGPRQGQLASSISRTSF